MKIPLKNRKIARHFYQELDKFMKTNHIFPRQYYREINETLHHIEKVSDYSKMSVFVDEYAMDRGMTEPFWMHKYTMAWYIDTIKIDDTYNILIDGMGYQLTKGSPRVGIQKGDLVVTASVSYYPHLLIVPCEEHIALRILGDDRDRLFNIIRMNREILTMLWNNDEFLYWNNWRDNIRLK